MLTLNMLKHKRDNYEAIFKIVSPANKKRRRENKQNEELFNNMEVDETEEIAKTNRMSQNS